MDRAYLQTSVSSLPVSNLSHGVFKVIPAAGLRSAQLLRSLTLALLITLLLILGMSQLIATDYREPAPDPYPKIQPIHMPQVAPTVVDSPKPVRPVDPPQHTIEPRVIDNPRTEKVPLIITAPPVTSGKADPTIVSSDPLPIYKPAPRYPSAALRRGIQGYVVVEFTITSNGSVRDASVVGGYDSEGNATTLFDRAALNAVERFKYKPPMDEGRAVERSGVRNRISFKLAE